MKANDYRTAVVVGNSVALHVRPPRRDRQEAPYPTLLARQFSDAGLRVINQSRASFDIEEALREFTPTVFRHDPDAVVLHVGINECAPRAIPPWMWRAIYAYPSDVLLNGASGVAILLARRVDQLIRTPMSRWFNRSWFSLRRFEQLLDGWLELVEKELCASIVIVGMGTPTERVSRALPGIAENVERFNSVLCRKASQRPRTVRWVDVAEWTAAPSDREALQPDGIHLSAQGHRLLADTLARYLEELLELARPS